MEPHPIQTRPDWVSGLIVSIIAIPLAMGIALASDAPLFASLLSCVIGGLIVGRLSGSEVAVSGSAAGLALIVAQSLHRLGSFDAFLCAVLLAGVFQLLMGVIRAGALANIFPMSVMRGLLAAIGVILTVKQIPHILGAGGGFDAESLLSGNSTVNPIQQIRAALQQPNATTIFLFFLSLAGVAFWNSRFLQRYRLPRLLPAALAILVLGTTLNELLRALGEHSPLSALELGGSQLVNLPLIRDFGDFTKLLHTPDWSALGRRETYGIALSLAAIASVETLLAIEAGDKLDRFFRMSSKNRELLAQGVGNIFAGLLGALPITAVIVRTTTNVFSGAQTRKSTLYHGLFVLLATLGGAKLLNHVPLACISAVLIGVSYKLVRPEIFLNAWKKGLTQFLPLITTLVAILLTDMLTGALLGLLVGFGMSLWTNYYSGITVIHEGKNWLIRFSKDVSFINRIRIKTTLEHIPAGASVVIDGSRAMFIDPDVIEELAEFKEHCRHFGIELELKGIEGKEYPIWSLRKRLKELT
jgi:MFS superfamily sulfate permease-like transporter